MEDRQTLSLRIQGTIEELKGGEEFEQKLAQRIQSTLQQINTVSTNFQQTAADQTQLLPQTDQKAVNTLKAAVDESTRNITARFENEYAQFEQDQEIYGLGKRQQTKWRGRFYKAGEQSIDEESALISDIFRERRRGADPETKQVLDNLEVQVREHFQKLKATFQEFGDGIPQYAKDIEQFKKANDSLFEMLKKGGYLALAQQVGDQALGAIRGLENIEARNQTSFNLTNAQANYNEVKQAQLFEETTKTSMWGSGIGSAVGAIAGGLVGGFNPLMMAGGASIGASFGNQIAELINIETRATVEKELKFLNQSYQEANVNFQRAKGYEIAATKTSARFGEDLRGTSGLGYTPEQELQFKEQFGESLRKFDEDLYKQQLTFSRATGLNFGDISQVNSLTRFTGQEFDIKKLSEVQDFTKQIYGDDDLKRIVDILGSIREISMKQLNRAVDADAEAAQRFLAAPQNLFGVNNAYGTMQELGGKTLQILEGLMQPSSSAHEAFLFQALGGKGIRDFNERMKGGIYDGDNFKDILNYAALQSGGDENQSYWLLNGMLKGAPKGFIDPLSKLISGGSIEIETTKGEGKRSVNLEEFLEAVEKGIKTTGESADVISKRYLEIADKNITKYETTEEKIGNIQMEIGNKWKDLLTDSQLKMAKLQEQWLTSGDTMSKVSGMLTESMEMIRQKMKEFGIEFRGKDEIKQDAINEKYNAVYKMNGGIEALEGETLEDYQTRTLKPKSELGTDWKGRRKATVYGVEEQREELRKQFQKIDDNEKQEIEKAVDYIPQDQGKGFRTEKEKKLSESLTKIEVTAKEISGFRTKADQERLKAQGRPVSDTSHHLTGHAFDVQYYNKEGKPITNEMITEDLQKNEGKRYKALRENVEKYAKENNLFWGGWFKDEKLRNQEWNHFQKNKNVEKTEPNLTGKQEIKTPPAKEIKNNTAEIEKTDDKTIEKIISSFQMALAQNNKQQPVEVTIKFVDTPLGMLDSVQNAIVGVL